MSIFRSTAAGMGGACPAMGNWTGFDGVSENVWKPTASGGYCGAQKAEWMTGAGIGTENVPGNRPFSLYVQTGRRGCLLG